MPYKVKDPAVVQELQPGAILLHTGMFELARFHASHDSIESETLSFSCTFQEWHPNVNRTKAVRFCSVRPTLHSFAVQ